MNERITPAVVEEITIPVKLPEMEIAEPTYYPLVFGTEKGMLVTVKLDGSVEYGPGFTTNEETAKLFWEQMGKQYVNVFRCGTCAGEMSTESGGAP